MIQAKTTISSGRPGRPEKYAANDVLTTALDLYWTEGVSALSVNNLVLKMGIPKPSLYRHFPSEDSLQACVLLAYESHHTCQLKCYYEPAGTVFASTEGFNRSTNSWNKDTQSRLSFVSDARGRRKSGAFGARDV